MGHIGLINQAVKLTGVRKVRGKTEEDRKKLLDDAMALQDAGICALGLELIAKNTAVKSPGRWRFRLTGSVRARVAMAPA